MGKLIVLLALGLAGLAVVKAEENQPERLDIPLSNARLQALPREVRRVYVGPDGRIWFNLDPSQLARGGKATITYRLFATASLGNSRRNRPNITVRTWPSSSRAAGFGSFSPSIACCSDTTAKPGSTMSFPTPAIEWSVIARHAAPARRAGRIATHKAPLGSFAPAAS